MTLMACMALVNNVHTINGGTSNLNSAEFNCLMFFTFLDYRQLRP